MMVMNDDRKDFRGICRKPKFFYGTAVVASFDNACLGGAGNRDRAHNRAVDQ